jgi:hypothetical protein
VRCAACPPDQLCSSCRGKLRSWLAGAVEVTGDRWAAECRARWPGRRWPAWEESPGLQAEARRRVVPFTEGDPELTEELARVCAAAAREAFYYPLRPGVVHRLVGEDDRARRVRLWGAEAVRRAERDGFDG